jgi:hypothetical protein
MTITTPTYNFPDYYNNYYNSQESTEKSSETEKISRAKAEAALREEQKQALQEQINTMDKSIFSSLFKKEETTDSASTESIKDHSAGLTSRLVSSVGQLEVRQVIAEANKNLAELRVSASSGDKAAKERAEELMSKLDKLLKRADRKLMDLGKEDDLKLQKVRAQRKKQLQLEKELADELHRRQTERRNREKDYLHEDRKDVLEELANIPGLSTENLKDAIADKLIGESAVQMSAGDTSSADFNASETSGASIDGASGEIFASDTLETAGSKHQSNNKKEL